MNNEDKALLEKYTGAQEQSGVERKVQSKADNMVAEQIAQDENLKSFQNFFVNQHQDPNNPFYGDLNKPYDSQSVDVLEYGNKRAHEKLLMDSGVSEKDIALYRAWDDAIYNGLKSGGQSGQAFDMDQMTSQSFADAAWNNYVRDEKAYGQYVALDHEINQADWSVDTTGNLTVADAVLDELGGRNEDYLHSWYNSLDATSKRMLRFDGIHNRFEFAEKVKDAKKRKDEYVEAKKHSGGFLSGVGDFFTSFGRGVLHSLFSPFKSVAEVGALIAGQATGHGNDWLLSVKESADRVDASIDEAMPVNDPDSWGSKIGSAGGGFAGFAIKAGVAVVTFGGTGAAEIAAEAAADAAIEAMAEGTAEGVVEVTADAAAEALTESITESGIEGITEGTIEATAEALGESGLEATSEELAEAMAEVMAEEGAADLTSEKLAENISEKLTNKAATRIENAIAKRGTQSLTKKEIEANAGKIVSKSESKFINSAKDKVSKSLAPKKYAKALNNAEKEAKNIYSIAKRAIARNEKGQVNKVISNVFDKVMRSPGLSKRSRILTNLMAFESAGGSVERSAARGDSGLETIMRGIVSFGGSKWLWGKFNNSAGGGVLGKFTSNEASQPAVKVMSLTWLQNSAVNNIKLVGEMKASGMLDKVISDTMQKVPVINDNGEPVVDENGVPVYKRESITESLKGVWKEELSVDSFRESAVNFATAMIWGAGHAASSGLIKDHTARRTMKHVEEHMTEKYGAVWENLKERVSTEDKNWKTYKSWAKTDATLHYALKIGGEFGEDIKDSIIKGLAIQPILSANAYNSVAQKDFQNDVDVATDTIKTLAAGTNIKREDVARALYAEGTPTVDPTMRGKKGYAYINDVVIELATKGKYKNVTSKLNKKEVDSLVDLPVEQISKIIVESQIRKSVPSNKVIDEVLDYRNSNDIAATLMKYGQDSDRLNYLQSKGIDVSDAIEKLKEHTKEVANKIENTSGQALAHFLKSKNIDDVILKSMKDKKDISQEQYEKSINLIGESEIKSKHVRSLNVVSKEVESIKNVIEELESVAKDKSKTDEEKADYYNAKLKSKTTKDLIDSINAKIKLIKNKVLEDNKTFKGSRDAMIKEYKKEFGSSDLVKRMYSIVDKIEEMTNEYKKSDKAMGTILAARKSGIEAGFTKAEVDTWNDASAARKLIRDKEQEEREREISIRGQVEAAAAIIEQARINRKEKVAEVKKENKVEEEEIEKEFIEKVLEVNEEKTIDEEAVKKVEVKKPAVADVIDKTESSKTLITKREAEKEIKAIEYKPVKTNSKEITKEVKLAMDGNKTVNEVVKQVKENLKERTINTYAIKKIKAKKTLAEISNINKIKDFLLLEEGEDWKEYLDAFANAQKTIAKINKDDLINLFEITEVSPVYDAYKADIRLFDKLSNKEIVEMIFRYPKDMHRLVGDKVVKFGNERRKILNTSEAIKSLNNTKDIVDGIIEANKEEAAVDSDFIRDALQKTLDAANGKEVSFNGVLEKIVGEKLFDEVESRGGVTSKEDYKEFANKWLRVTAGYKAKINKALTTEAIHGRGDFNEFSNGLRNSMFERLEEDFEKLPALKSYKDLTSNEWSEFADKYSITLNAFEDGDIENISSSIKDEAISNLTGVINSLPVVVDPSTLFTTDELENFIRDASMGIKFDKVTKTKYEFNRDVNIVDMPMELNRISFAEKLISKKKNIEQSIEDDINIYVDYKNKIYNLDNVLENSKDKSAAVKNIIDYVNLFDVNENKKTQYKAELIERSINEKELKVSKLKQKQFDDSKKSIKEISVIDKQLEKLKKEKDKEVSDALSNDKAFQSASKERKEFLDKISKPRMKINSLAKQLEEKNISIDSRKKLESELNKNTSEYNRLLEIGRKRINGGATTFIESLTMKEGEISRKVASKINEKYSSKIKKLEDEKSALSIKATKQLNEIRDFDSEIALLNEDLSKTKDKLAKLDILKYKVDFINEKISELDSMKIKADESAAVFDAASKVASDLIISISPILGDETNTYVNRVKQYLLKGDMNWVDASKKEFDELNLNGQGISYTAWNEMVMDSTIINEKNINDIIEETRKRVGGKLSKNANVALHKIYNVLKQKYLAESEYIRLTYGVYNKEEISKKLKGLDDVSLQDKAYTWSKKYDGKSLIEQKEELIKQSKESLKDIENLQTILQTNDSFKKDIFDTYIFNKENAISNIKSIDESSRTLNEFIKDGEILNYRTDAEMFDDVMERLITSPEIGIINSGTTYSQLKGGRVFEKAWSSGINFLAISDQNNNRINIVGLNNFVNAKGTELSIVAGESVQWTGESWFFDYISNNKIASIELDVKHDGENYVIKDIDVTSSPISINTYANKALSSLFGDEANAQLLKRNIETLLSNKEDHIFEKEKKLIEVEKQIDEDDDIKILKDNGIINEVTYDGWEARHDDMLSDAILAAALGEDAVNTEIVNTKLQEMIWRNESNRLVNRFIRRNNSRKVFKKLFAKKVFKAFDRLSYNKVNNDSYTISLHDGYNNFKLNITKQSYETFLEKEGINDTKLSRKKYSSESPYTINVSTDRNNKNFDTKITSSHEGHSVVAELYDKIRKGKYTKDDKNKFNNKESLIRSNIYDMAIKENNSKDSVEAINVISSIVNRNLSSIKPATVEEVVEKEVPVYRINKLGKKVQKTETRTEKVYDKSGEFTTKTITDENGNAIRFPVTRIVKEKVKKESKSFANERIEKFNKSFELLKDIAKDKKLSIKRVNDIVQTASIMLAGTHNNIHSIDIKKIDKLDSIFKSLSNETYDKNGNFPTDKTWVDSMLSKYSLQEETLKNKIGKLRIEEEDLTTSIDDVKRRKEILDEVDNINKEIELIDFKKRMAYNAGTKELYDLVFEDFNENGAYIKEKSEAIKPNADSLYVEPNELEDDYDRLMKGMFGVDTDKRYYDDDFDEENGSGSDIVVQGINLETNLDKEINTNNFETDMSGGWFKILNKYRAVYRADHNSSDTALNEYFKDESLESIIRPGIKTPIYKLPDITKSVLEVSEFGMENLDKEMSNIVNEIPSNEIESEYKEKVEDDIEMNEMTDDNNQIGDDSDPC